MMKKIIILFCVIGCFIQAKAQFPFRQTESNNSTMYYIRGGTGIDSTLIFAVAYADTANANFGWIDNIAGAVIRTTDDKLWLRNNVATAWIEIGSGGGGGGGGVNSVLGTANRITSSGGANPVIDIAATYVGQTSITTLGTITTGVWNGTAIGNSFLANSSITIGSTAISLGATSTTLAGLTSVSSTSFTGALTGNATTATALATGRTISITGDLSYTSPSFDGSGNVTAAGTLATVNGNVGSFGSATQVGSFTVNGKGLITAASNVTITPAESSITFTDITTNNVSTSAHGFFPKLTANTVYYVSNAGALTALALGSSGQVLTSNGATSAPTFETPAAGGVAWNAITAPTGDLALTFQAGESTTFTDENTTEDHWTVNNATSTTNSLYSLNRTSTALAAGNNIMELVSSGANGTSGITAKGLSVSMTNTGTTSTNIAIDVTATGAATNNIGMFVNNVPANQTGIILSPTSSLTNAMLVGYLNSGTNWSIYALNSTFLDIATGGGDINIVPAFTTVQTASTNKITNFVRILNRQGADVASVAGAIALGTGGNTFEITGTNAITLISNTNWQNGSIVTLLFTSTATLTDGTANSGSDIGMELAGNANFVASAGAIVTLVLSEIGGTQRWREMARSVN